MHTIFLYHWITSVFYFTFCPTYEVHISTIFNESTYLCICFSMVIENCCFYFQTKMEYSLFFHYDNKFVKRICDTFKSRIIRGGKNHLIAMSPCWVFRSKWQLFLWKPPQRRWRKESAWSIISSSKLHSQEIGTWMFEFFSDWKSNLK